MRKKIIGIFIIMLLIFTGIPTFGFINELQSIDINYYENEFVPGEFIVKFKESSIFSVSIDNLNEKYNVNSIEKLFKKNEDTILDNIYCFYVSKDADILSIVEEYNLIDNVLYAEPNYIRYICGIPNDPGFGNQWALNNTGNNPNPNQGAGTPDCDIDAPEAWDIETGSSDVVIAIIDTGVDYTHPDISDNIWVNNDEIPNNGIDDDENGYKDDIRGWNFIDDGVYDGNNPLDVTGHGTMCAGIASAVTNNGIGIAGVCWGCKIMPVRSFNKNFYGSNEDISIGISYATDNGANIISMSFTDYIPSNLMNDSLNYAYGKGIVLIAAAGNDDRTVKAYPAACDNVIAVSATDHNDSRMNYRDGSSRFISNYGFWVDVAAPGVWCYSTMPTYHVTLNNYGMDENYSFGGIGTSFACPFVAGLAGLILSKNPMYSPEKIKLITRANVDPYDSEVYIGTGRINAYKALMEFNTQPEIPDAPTGKTNGKPGREYSFTTSATDEDDDDLYYFWDWGDSNYSDWLGPYSSGEKCEASYTWLQEANFSIKVKVKDGNGGESYWSEEFIFSTPKNKATEYPSLSWFLEKLINRFPFLAKILNQIIL